MRVLLSLYAATAAANSDGQFYVSQGEIVLVQRKPLAGRGEERGWLFVSANVVVGSSIEQVGLNSRL